MKATHLLPLKTKCSCHMDSKSVKILQIASLTPKGNACLAEEFTVSRLWEQKNPEEFLQQQGDQFAAIVTAARKKVDAALISLLPSLQMIATRGVGYDHIDLAAAHKKHIVVSHTPGVLTDCVADLAFGALIAVSRELVKADCFVRGERWPEQSYPLTTRVSGKRLGIVGLGRIGEAIGRRATGFSMTIRYHNRSERPEASWSYEPSLQALAQWADFLVIATPGGVETRKLVSAEIMDALGPQGFLINVARGSVVDEQALILALKDGRIAGAALDVFEYEPLVPKPFLEMDNVLLLPHIAGSTRETFAAMENLVLDNLRSFFQTGRPVTPVR